MLIVITPGCGGTLKLVERWVFVLTDTLINSILVFQLFKHPHTAHNPCLRRSLAQPLLSPLLINPQPLLKDTHIQCDSHVWSFCHTPSPTLLSIHNPALDHTLTATLVHHCSCYTCLNYMWHSWSDHERQTVMSFHFPLLWLQIESMLNNVVCNLKVVRPIFLTTCK